MEHEEAKTDMYVRVTRVCVCVAMKEAAKKKQKKKSTKRKRTTRTRHPHRVFGIHMRLAYVVGAQRGPHDAGASRRAQGCSREFREPASWNRIAEPTRDVRVKRSTCVERKNIRNCSLP